MTPMLPQPASPNTHLDPAVLTQAERQLARLVGPVAKLLVKRAAAATNDVDRLYRLLAATLSDSDRAAFLAPAAQRTRPQLPQPAASQWDPEVLKQVEHQLAQLVGPVARLMVRRAAGWTDDLDDLYSILADRLADPDERAWLLDGRSSIVPSRESAPEPTTVTIEAARFYPVVAAPRAALPARRDRLAARTFGTWRSTVSRFFSEDLRVRLAPAEVLAGGSSIACDPAFGTEPWQGAIATLKNMEWTKPCRVTVVLSNHFVRYAVIPWSDGLATPVEEEAYLRHHFGKIHGERAKGWSLRASEAPRGAQRLASAIDTALVEALKGAFPKNAKAKLVSVQPELMETANRWRQAIPAAGAWLVLAEPERACIALHASQGWRSVQNAKGDWFTLLDRERYRLHGAEGEVPSLVLLSGTKAPANSDGWEFRELAA
jgi:hypothetical protein